MAGPPKEMLVTSAFHMPRAKFLFEKQGFTVSEYSVDFKVRTNAVKPMDFLPQADALAITENAIREQLGFYFFRLKYLLSDTNATPPPLKAAGPAPATFISEKKN